MITGIQITKANDQALVNSFWLLDDEKAEARCVCAKANYAEDQVVAVSDRARSNTVKCRWKCSRPCAWKAVST